jgi:hypothetical protein
MATDHLQIPDITATQNQKEITANSNFNLTDRALNGETPKTITGSDSLTTTEARQNILIRLTGTPGAGFNLDMPDTNKRLICIQNDTGQDATVRNSVGGGTTVVVADTQRKFLHYDGTDLRTLAQLDNDLARY